MWTWFFMMAEITSIGVGQLDDAMANPNCPDKVSSYCNELFVTHCFLGSVGLMIIALEYVKAATKTASESKKAR